MAARESAALNRRRNTRAQELVRFASAHAVDVPAWHRKRDRGSGNNCGARLRAVLCGSVLSLLEWHGARMQRWDVLGFRRRRVHVVLLPRWTGLRAQRHRLLSLCHRNGGQQRGHVRSVSSWHVCPPERPCTVHSMRRSARGLLSCWRRRHGGGVMFGGVILWWRKCAVNFVPGWQLLGKGLRCVHGMRLRRR